MNKKYLFLILLSFLLLIPFKINALELSDGTAVNSNNVYVYFEENNLYKEEYPYCFFGDGTINCFESTENIYYDSSSQMIMISNTNNYYWYYSGSKDKVVGYSFSITSSGYSIPMLTNFDILNSDGSVYMIKNWSLGTIAATTYNITFDSSLSDYEIVVKDSENNIISSNEDGTYTLESGTYYYSATKGGYKEINDIEFVVSQDETITIEFEKIIDDSNIKIIFTSILSNIENIISTIYVNQLFIYLISVIMIFFIVFLIVKLLKGD